MSTDTPTTQNTTTGLGWLDAEDGPAGASLVAARRAHEIAQSVTDEQARLRISLEHTAAQDTVPVGPAPLVGRYSGYDA